MKIICDTNIWYELGNKPPSEETMDNKQLIGTYLSIDEFSKTYNLVNHFEHTQRAIQAMMEYSSLVQYEPPFIYLKRLDDPRTEFNPLQEIKKILDFTANIANGHEIDPSQKDNYIEYCKKREQYFQEACDLFNEEANNIKEQIKAQNKNKDKHRKENSIPLNRNFISFLVSEETDTSELSNNFDWSQIELFENVLKLFFNDMELGAIKLQPNDWYDLFFLTYVQPGSKIWTKENRWIKYIQRAGMDNYLYEQPNN